MAGDAIWSSLHDKYAGEDWINKPSLFATEVATYLPSSGNLLELGAGQGQDSRFFAELGYDVTSSDLPEIITRAKAQQDNALTRHIAYQEVDLRQELPFPDDQFDVVYAHLSIHYFNSEITLRLINEVQRILKPNGIFTFLVNSQSDPEYTTVDELEPGFLAVGDMTKRYFSLDSTREYMKYFDTILLDDHGETYKDAAKGVSHLVRYVGQRRASHTYDMAIPFVGAIIERLANGEREVLMMTRWKPAADPVYSGTLEIPAGVLDHPFENIFHALEREILEEVGLKLKSVRDGNGINYTGDKNDIVLGFKPFYCVQQLQNGKPLIGFIFIAEVEDSLPVAQLSEAKDARWIDYAELKIIVEYEPEKVFATVLPALRAYCEIERSSYK